MTMLIQGLIAVIVIGEIYTLWRTSKSYGGLIGRALRWIGFGMIFFSLEAVDRGLGSLSFINPLSHGNSDLFHNIVLLLGLLFSAFGFSQLTKIAK